MSEMHHGRVVVVGAGHAGIELAAALRKRGFAGGIELVSDDLDWPYQRPPLSKEHIRRPDDPLLLKPAQFFADSHVSLLLGRRAAVIDRKNARLRLEDGATLAYDHLVLATGARNSRPPVPGLDHRAVFGLRTLADANRLVGAMRCWGRVAVIGGGFVGLEAAALLAAARIAVHVIERAPRLMQRVVSPAVSAWFADWHRRHGVDLRLETQVGNIERSGAGMCVTLTDGDRLAVDAVILAAGVQPNIELAAAAGLATANGVVVDAHLLTADPAISAIGDCANFPSLHLPGRARLESVQNAVDHARAVAARLTGETKAYDAVPWFWSVQGEARLQIAGLSKPGLREVVRGDPASGKFSLFLLQGERLAAVESVNAAADHMLARRLIAENRTVDPAKVVDPTVDLKDLLTPSP